MKLITVPMLKRMMDGKTDAQFDKMLETIVNGVSATIQSFLNRYLEKDAYTAYFEATGRTYKYWFPAYPVDLTATFTVTVNDLEYTIDEDFFVTERSGLVEFYLPPPRIYPKGIKIIGTGGYEEIDDSSDENGSLDVPDDIKLAAYVQCIYEFKHRNDVGVQSVQLPDGSLKKFSKPSNLLPEVKSRLFNYRRLPQRS